MEYEFMLRSAKELFGYKLIANDGKIGSVRDLIFDERSSTIRYIVADTGGWLTGRRVLLSPASFGTPDWREQAIPVSLTKEQIEGSPEIDEDQTVSRQNEVELGRYYGWPAYWAAAPEAGGYIAAPLPESLPGEAQGQSKPESHLRSMREVMGYHIQAVDGEIGHVDDFVFQDETWINRYMVVDTRNWLPGRKVLVSPLWIQEIDWQDRKVHVNMMQESIRQAPEFDATEPVNRDYEVRLFDYYGRPKYW
jgi:uncharacterized protein YrrD